MSLTQSGLFWKLILPNLVLTTLCCAASVAWPEMTMWVIIGFAPLFLLQLGFGYHLVAGSRLQGLANALAQSATGKAVQLDAMILEGSDVIATIARFVQAVQQQKQTAVQNVSAVAARIATATEELARLTDSATSQVQHQQSQTDLVATAVNAVSDVVIPGETGLLVPPGRPDLMAAAVEYLLDSPATAARMAGVARTRLGDRYGLPALRSALIEAYRGSRARSGPAQRNPMGTWSP